jgi:hypothetical protein
MKKALLTLVSLLLATAVQAQTCNPNIVKTKLNSQYIVSGDGTEVTDTKTGLIWQRCVLGMSWDKDASTCTSTASSYTWEGALAQAATVASTTSVAWRLPNIKELKSLVETACYSSAINESVFPNTPSGTWSSSAVAYYTNYAWYVNFNYGLDVWDSKNDGLAVRLVRSQ